MSVSIGLYARYSTEDYFFKDFRGLNNVELFNRGEYVHFDWGMYLAIIAVILGAVTTILGFVAACVTGCNKSKSGTTSIPVAVDLQFESDEKF